MTQDARLKSLFIFPAIILMALGVVVSIVMAAIGYGDRLSWIGAAMACAPLPLLVLQLTRWPRPRTAEFLPGYLLLMLAGLIIAGRSMYSDFVESWELYQNFISAVVAAFYVSPGSLPAILAIVATIVFLLYVFWYSRFGRYHDARLDVGGKLPEFEARDLDGNTVKSSEFVGSPTVFLFYRGNWCPLCMAQIDEIVERYKAIEELGITVCLISPQDEEHTRSLSEKHGLSFRYLIDEGNKAADALEIGVKNGVPLGISGYPSDSVMPTMIVTSAGGTIIFSDQTDNYRVRPEPDIFLAILRRARALAA